MFLDKGHTLGIDIRLSPGYSVAVPLGPNLTKNRQACVRMRRFGHGQTVVSCVLPEAQEKIRSMECNPGKEIEVSNMILWSISETHKEMHRNIPL